MESEADEESQQQQQHQEEAAKIGDGAEISLEYREFDGNYETIAVASPQNYPSPGASKAKYYKQTYRPAWEHMPDFKGWLTGVQGEPTRAYCLYCQKTLHAHRLSLLKHTCTIRHQKAAQLHNTRKGKALSGSMEPQITFIEGNSSNQDGMDNDEEETMVEYTTVEVEEHENEIDQDQDEAEDDEESIGLEGLPVQFHKVRSSQATTMSAGGQKPPISTHVLDTSKGQPVSGLQVSLYKLIDGRWTYINEGYTNTDGRFANFLERGDFTPGRYKLHYDVDRYFEVRKQDSLYPFIEIVFDCRTHSDHYHVPLLLSPFGYTTYRGS